MGLKKISKKATPKSSSSSDSSRKEGVVVGTARNLLPDLESRSPAKDGEV